MAGPVVITGGGTGGHIFPMQAVAHALIAEGISADDLRYVGSQRGQERELLAGDAVALTLLPGRGIRRSLHPRDLARSLRSLIALTRAVVTSLRLVRSWKPRVVASVGGYASFPMTFAAALHRVPVVSIELDATPSAAQRVLLRRVSRRCCAFPTAGANVVVTGAPVRDTISNIDRSASARLAARSHLNPTIDAGRTVIVVMTGSLGSTRVNTAVVELATQWRERRDITILHVTGRRDYEHIVANAPVCDGLDYRVIAFGDMVELWSVADLCVCRAGATTIAEITTLGLASLLVPLPNAPGDHQTKNARVLVDAGAAVMIRDHECDGASIARALSPWLNEERRDAAEAAALLLAHVNAARRIADEILDVGGHA